jgi:hypothetical protein
LSSEKREERVDSLGLQLIKRNIILRRETTKTSGIENDF